MEIPKQKTPEISPKKEVVEDQETARFFATLHKYWTPDGFWFPYNQEISFADYIDEIEIREVLRKLKVRPTRLEDAQGAVLKFHADLKKIDEPANLSNDEMDKMEFFDMLDSLQKTRAAISALSRLWSDSIAAYLYDYKKREETADFSKKLYSPEFLDLPNAEQQRQILKECPELQAAYDRFQIKNIDILEN